VSRFTHQPDLAAVGRAAQAIVDKLNLTPEEQVFSSELSQLVGDLCFRRYCQVKDRNPQLRRVAIEAALASLLAGFNADPLPPGK
jgi:hypothetical protein